MLHALINRSRKYTKSQRTAEETSVVAERHVDDAQRMPGALISSQETLYLQRTTVPLCTFFQDMCIAPAFVSSIYKLHVIV